MSKAEIQRQQSRIAQVLEAVGPAGDQARADEARYFAVDEQQSSARQDKRSLDLVVASTSGDAALITMAERSWYKGRPRGSAFEVYLVVRDATSGERHVLRVPPKFGRYTSATFQRYLRPKPLSAGYDAAEWDAYRANPYTGDADGLIHEAIAWTFGLKSADYKPDAAA